MKAIVYPLYLFSESWQRSEAWESGFGCDESSQSVELLLQHVDVVAEVLRDHRSQRAVDQLLFVLGEQILKFKFQPNFFQLFVITSLVGKYPFTWLVYQSVDGKII